MQLFASLGSEQDGDQPLHRLVALAMRAEQLRFDVLWTAEHHATPWNICPDPLLLIAHLAALTKRIRLGTAVVNLTLHHPVAVAERALLVDALSQGRLELGIGRGFAAADYALYGIDVARTEEVFSQHHERLARSLARVDVPLRPIGSQRPWPPIWLATTGNQRSIDLAARRGYGLLVAGNAERLRSGLARYRERWASVRSEPPRVAVTRAVHVAASRRQAWEEMVEPVRWYLDQLARLQPDAPGPGLEAVMTSFCVLGSPGHCQQQILDLRAQTGMTHLNCVFGIGSAPVAMAERSMDSFAREVLPELQALD